MELTAKDVISLILPFVLNALRTLIQLLMVHAKLSVLNNTFITIKLQIVVNHA